MSNCITFPPLRSLVVPSAAPFPSLPPVRQDYMHLVPPHVYLMHLASGKPHPYLAPIPSPILTSAPAQPRSQTVTTSGPFSLHSLPPAPSFRSTLSVPSAERIVEGSHHKRTATTKPKTTTKRKRESSFDDDAESATEAASPTTSPSSPASADSSPCRQPGGRGDLASKAVGGQVLKWKLNSPRYKRSKVKVGGEEVWKRCAHCGTDSTPEWRAGPLGKGTLCNACGLRYRSKTKERSKSSEARGSRVPMSLLLNPETGSKKGRTTAAHPMIWETKVTLAAPSGQQE